MSPSPAWSTGVLSDFCPAVPVPGWSALHTNARLTSGLVRLSPLRRTLQWLVRSLSVKAKSCSPSPGLCEPPQARIQPRCPCPHLPPYSFSACRQLCLGLLLLPSPCPMGSAPSTCSSWGSRTCHGESPPPSVHTAPLQCFSLGPAPRGRTLSDDVFLPLSLPCGYIRSRLSVLSAAVDEEVHIEEIG